MKKIYLSDVRHAIAYVSGEAKVQDLSDAELEKVDFCHDLKFGNIRLVNVLIELERRHGFCLPPALLRKASNDTVGSFLAVINSYLTKAS
jgi:hypothetical protein